MWPLPKAKGCRGRPKESKRALNVSRKRRSLLRCSFFYMKGGTFLRGAPPFPQLMHYCSNTHSLGDCLLNQKRIRKFRAAFLGSVFGIRVQSFFGLKSSSLFYSQTSNFRVAKTKERRAVPPECITEGKISSFGGKEVL